MVSWYIYRNKDGKEIKRNRPSLLLLLKGYKLIAVYQ